jgi:hypothetical protein
MNMLPSKENTNEPSPASAGSHGEPVAWGVATSGGFVVYAMRTRSEAARYVADETNIVPLYRSPTLTDEEREALEVLRDGDWECIDRKTYEQITAAISGLLERTK